MESDSLSSFLQEGELAGSRYRFAALGRAPQGTAGSQLARAAGESMEFMEHRDYQPGDDLRRMNWSAYARSDRLVVKVFRQEVSPHVDLVIDGSRSMNLTETEKQRATLGMAAALACAAEHSGYSRLVTLTRNGCQPIRGGTDRPPAWQGLEFVSELNPAESFRMQPPRFKPHGLRVFVSDLLWMGNPLEVLNLLADQAAATIVVQILAASDAEPASIGSHRLIDSETGEALELFVDASGQQHYRENLARHQQAWRQAARQLGVTLVSFVAEELCRDWDLSPLVQAEVLAIG